jgi:Dual specificity phosphatase, catalytic domain
LFFLCFLFLFINNIASLVVLWSWLHVIVPHKPTSEMPSRILPWLLVGPYTAAETAESRRRHGIKWVLNVERGGRRPEDWGEEEEEEERGEDAHDRYIQRDMNDVGTAATDLSEVLPELLRFVERARLALGGALPTRAEIDGNPAGNADPISPAHPSLLVHCEWGINRSSTVVLAFLMKHTSCSVDAGLEFLRRRRPEVEPMPGYLEQLRAWETAGGSAATGHALSDSGPGSRSRSTGGKDEVAAFVEALRPVLTGNGDSSSEDEPAFAVLGRVAKFRPGIPHERTHLTHDPADAVAFFLGHEGMNRLLSCRGTAAVLELIGFTKEYVAAKQAAGIVYELLVCPAPHASSPGTEGSAGGSLRPVLATWDGVAAVLATHFKRVLPFFEEHRPALESRSFEDFQAAAGFEFLPVHIAGEENDARYLTYARACSTIDKTGQLTMLEVRRFLFHEMGLRGLFRGDGHTYTEDGQRGVREYFVPNVRRERVPGLQVVGLPRI